MPKWVPQQLTTLTWQNDCHWRLCCHFWGDWEICRERDQETFVHRLGNLVLLETSRNKSLANAAHANKRSALAASASTLPSASWLSTAMTAFTYERDLEHPVTREVEQTIRDVLQALLSSQGWKACW